MHGTIERIRRDWDDKKMRVTLIIIAAIALLAPIALALYSANIEPFASLLMLVCVGLSMYALKRLKDS